MSIRGRVERLERGQGDQVEDVICLFWPETPPEERAKVKAEARRRLAAGQLKPGAMYWRDWEEVTPPR